MVIDKYGGENGAEQLAKYIVLSQVASSTGGANCIADVMVLGAWHSSGNLLEGFEVKISRADWLNELKKPNKSYENKKYCDKWWLVIADQSMVKGGELPEDWGMMAVVDGELKVIKKAPLLQSAPMSHDFVASLLRTDARGSIPLDVHNDELKDERLNLEAEYKARYSGLLSFVKELHNELGIKLENSNSSDRPGDWYARIGSFELQKLVSGGSWNLTPRQLSSAIKIALAGDMRTIKWELESVAVASRKMLTIAEEFSKKEEL